MSAQRPLALMLNATSTSWRQHCRPRRERGYARRCWPTSLPGRRRSRAAAVSRGAKRSPRRWWRRVRRSPSLLPTRHVAGNPARSLAWPVRVGHRASLPTGHARKAAKQRPEAGFPGHPTWRRASSYRERPPVAPRSVWVRCDRVSLAVAPRAQKPSQSHGTADASSRRLAAVLSLKVMAAAQRSPIESPPRRRGHALLARILTIALRRSGSPATISHAPDRRVKVRPR